MAEINLAEKYMKKVAERYSIGSLTDAYAGKDYDFEGVNGITIYSINTVPMVDYVPSGTDRFGELTELGDTKQTLQIRKNRGFTYSIDVSNSTQQYNVKQNTRSLKRQIDEVVTPEIDMYRFEQWAAGAGLNTATAITKANAIETIMTGGMTMSNALVPMKNRALFIKQSIYLHCKLADVVVGLEGLGNKAIKNGSVGTLDGMKVIPVPDSYFPEGVNFIIKYKDATVDPMKLKNYRILTEQRGVDGAVVEGHVMYDSFVLDTKKNGIFVSSVA